MAKKKSRRIVATAPKAVLFAACDSVSRDPNTGKPTLYGLFDIIWASEFPCRFRPFALYAKVVGAGQHVVSFHLVGPRGRSEKLGEAELKIPSNQKAAIQADLAGLEFKRPGRYEVLLRAGRKTLGRTSFEVKRKATAKRKK